MSQPWVSWEIVFFIQLVAVLRNHKPTKRMSVPPWSGNFIGRAPQCGWQGGGRRGLPWKCMSHGKIVSRVESHPRDFPEIIGEWATIFKYKIYFYSCHYIYVGIWVMLTLFPSPRTSLLHVPKGFGQWQLPGHLIHNFVSLKLCCDPDAMLWIQSSLRRQLGTCPMLALAKYQTKTQTKDMHL